MTVEAMTWFIGAWSIFSSIKIEICDCEDWKKYPKMQKQASEEFQIFNQPKTKGQLGFLVAWPAYAD